MKNIKKRFLIIGLFCLCFVALLACRSASNGYKELPPSIVTKDSSSTTITYRDTLLIIESDSSWYRAYVDCKNGKPVLQKPRSKSGERVKAPQVQLNDNVLSVDCESEKQELKAQIKELESKLIKTTEKTIPILTERSKSTWEKFIQTSGYALWLLVLLVAAAYLFKK